MAEANKQHILGGTAIKPKERHGWERVRYILYNPETGQILSRFEIHFYSVCMESGRFRIFKLLGLGFRTHPSNKVLDFSR